MPRAPQYLNNLVSQLTTIGEIVSPNKYLTELYIIFAPANVDMTIVPCIRGFDSSNNGRPSSCSLY